MESRVAWLHRYIDRYAAEIEAAPKIQLAFHLGAGKPKGERHYFDELEPVDAPRQLKPDERMAS